MAGTFTYQPVDMDFLDSAPAKGTIRQKIPASASATFKSLEDGEAWPVWFDILEKVTWTSEPPFGAGTTRDIHTSTGVVMEKFFHWQDGRRMSFFFARGEMPFFAAFAEDYEVIPLTSDTCELVWRFGFRCRGIYRLFQSAVAFFFKRGSAKSLAQLAEFMSTNAHRY